MEARVRGDGNDQVVAPALASGAAYPSRLSARSALYVDLSLLPRAAGAPHSSEQYRMVNRGELPRFKVGGSWRFQKEDLDAWIAKQKVAATHATGDEG